tara:strand:- start:2920 stop:3438 length:519 start_codon:yes stop_codon:yes gene_type:complete
MFKIINLSLILIFLVSCSAIKREKVDTRKVPINAQERARKNIEEGKGTSLKDILGRGGSTTYEFSSSNAMWRASLELLDFLPLSTVDYSGGMIISDWYSEGVSDESIKITVRFLDNEIRSDSLKITVHKKICKSISNCRITLINNNAIANELLTSIIKKAAEIQKISKKQKK